MGWFNLIRALALTQIKENQESDNVTPFSIMNVQNAFYSQPNYDPFSGTVYRIKGI